MKGKEFKRNLPVSLTGAEVDDRRDRLVEAVGDYRKVEDEKKASAADFGEKLKGTRAKMEELSEAIRYRQEVRPVACFHEVSLPTGRVEIVREDTGEIIEVRDMTPQEVEEYSQRELSMDRAH